MQNATEYFNKKIELLSELLKCSEDIMSSINQDKWESYGELGKKRIEAIETINALEAQHRVQFDPLLEDEQRKAINAKVELILGFERDIVLRIKEEREIALKSMEVGKNENIIFNAYTLGDSQ